MKDFYRDVLAAGMAGLSFLLLYFRLARGNLLFCLVFALVVYLALKILIPRQRQAMETVPDEGLTQADLQTILRYGQQKAQVFYEASHAIANAQISHRLYSIGNTIEKIFQHFQTDPDDINASHDFIYHDLEKAIEIVQMYQNLVAVPQLNEEERQNLDQAEQTIELIQQAFQNQYKMLLENDFREFSVAQASLQQILLMKQPALLNQLKSKDTHT